MPWDPFTDSGAVALDETNEKPREFDPFRDAGAIDLTPPRRSAIGESVIHMGKALAEAPGSIVENAGRALDSVADLGRAVYPAGLLADTRPGTALIKGGGDLRKWGGDLYQEQEKFRPDPVREGELLPQLGGGVGSMAQIFAVPGGHVPKLVAGVLQAGGMGVDDLKDARARAIAEGKPAPQASEQAAFATSAPLGLLNEIPLARLGRFAAPLEKIVSRPGVLPTLGKVISESVKQGVAQALAGGAQQFGQNLVASKLLEYDPERDATQGVGTAALHGGILGAAMGGAGQGAAEIGDRGLHWERRMAGLEQNLAEQNARPADALAQFQARRETAPAPATDAPAREPGAPPVSLDDVFADVANEQRARDEARARAEKKRGERRASATDRAALFPQLTAAIDETLAQGEGATYARVSGLANQAQAMAEDNAIGFSREQREGLLTRAKALDELRSRLQASEDELQQTNRQQAFTQLNAAAESRKTALEAERKQLRELKRQGIGPSGEFDYEDAPLPALEKRAEGGDTRAQEALMRRNEREAVDAADDRHSLLDVLREKKLPARDTGSLDAELQDLIREGMNFGQRKSLVENEPGSLDNLVTSLRADHGFSQLETPSDLIEAVKDELAGRRVLPEQSAVDFARTQPNRLGVKEQKGLDAAARAVEDRAADFVNARSDAENDAAYNARPDARGGRVLNTDVARQLSERDAEYFQPAPTEDASGGAPGMERATRTEIRGRDERGRAGGTTQPGEDVGAQEAQGYLREIERAFPTLWREWQVETGIVGEILRKRTGQEFAVTDAVEAAIHHDGRVLAFAFAAWKNRARGAARFTHEMGHSYWNALPREAQALLTEQHGREVGAARRLREPSLSAEERAKIQREAGPLFDEQGRNTRGIAYLDELTPRSTREWFAERIATLNAEWAEGRLRNAGRNPAMRALHRAAEAVRELFERVMRAFARHQGSDPESDFWQKQFREFLVSQDRSAAQAAGRAEAARLDFATLEKLPALEHDAGHERGSDLHGGEISRGAQGGAELERDARRRRLAQIQAKYDRGGIDRDIAARALALHETLLREGPAGEKREYPIRLENQHGTGQRTPIRPAESVEELNARIARKTGIHSEEELAALHGAVAAYDRGEKFAFPPGMERVGKVPEFATAEGGKGEVPLEDALAAARATAAEKRESFEHAEATLKATDEEIAALKTSQAADGEQRGRALAARRKGAEALRASHYTAYTAARDRVALWQDRIRMRDEGQKTLEAQRTENPREALVAKYDALGAQMEEQGKAGKWSAVQLLKEERARLREQLDQKHPEWRQGRGVKKAEAEAPEEAAGGSLIEKQPGEDEALPPPKREYKVNDQKRRAVEGHSLDEESGLARTWKAIRARLRDFAGATPELPVFPESRFASDDPFTKKTPQFYNRVKEGIREMKRANAAVFKDAEQAVASVLRPLLALSRKEKFPARDYTRLRELQAQARRLEADGERATPAMEREITRLQDAVERDPYVLFERLVMYHDLAWRAQNLHDDVGNPIALPGGLNREEVQARLADLTAKAKASPHAGEVATALRAHTKLVADIARDLNERELLPAEALRNPWYFPHLVIERTQGRLERVKIDTAQDFRGYLQDPIGSNKPIESDYVRAMYYHTVQVLGHNRHADLIEEYFRKPYDIKEAVAKRARALSRERGAPVSWRQAFFEEYADKGYKLYGAGDGPSFVPALQIDRNKLAQVLGHTLTAGPLREQLKKLGVDALQLRPEDIHEALMAGEREVWIVPEKVAEALHGAIRRAGESDGAWTKILGAVQGAWKRNILFAPWNYPRYEFGNTIADLEKGFSADPVLFKKLPQALREVRAFWGGKGVPTEEVRAAFRLGVLDSVTAHEVGMLPELREFEALATDRQKMWNWLRSHNTVTLSRYREATFRYAKFLADLERIKNGARPNYAGAYWKDIEAIEDSAPGANDRAQRQAAEISLKTFGDYNDISVNGAAVRKLLVPFYSWMEINWRYHANLFRNMRDALAGHDSAQARSITAAAGRAASVAGFTLTRKAAAMFITRLALPYLAVAAWNNTGDREQLEDELSEEDKRRVHIIVGRDEKGRVKVIYAPTAFSDVVKWFGGPEAARLAIDVFRGRTDVKTAIGEWSQRVVPDFINTAIGSAGPLIKVPYIALSKRNPFPDVTDQRTVSAADMRRVILSNAIDQTTADWIERATNKDYLAPKDAGEWMQQAILQVRRRDPEQWAFYGIKEKANEFLEQRTGRKDSGGGYDAPDQEVLRNFRRSIYRGDVANALRFYDRLLELGYTADRFTASLRAQDPLSVLGKQGEAGNLRKQFVDGLNPYDREMLGRAFAFYQRMNTLRGDEKVLFPRAGVNERQADALRRNFHARPDMILREIMEQEAKPDDQVQQRIDRDIQQSLRVKR